MVIDFSEAVSATKYLSVNSDNADKVYIFVFEEAGTEKNPKNLGSKAYMFICMLSIQDGKNK